jgi:dihydroorotase
MQELSITQPDDWHLHLRDGLYLKDVVNDSARHFARAIIMPNLRPPVTTVKAALAYRDRILSAVRPDLGFEPLMTLYLTDETSLEEIRAAANSPHVHAFKLYPAGATTNSDSGVQRLDALDPLFDGMQEAGIPLLIHGEVTDPEIDIFDREAIFIDRYLTPIVERFPHLKIVLEHITTQEGVQFVEASRAGVAATLTAHHLLLNRNDMLVGGIKPHLFCLPILKREVHRKALLAAATSGNPKFFLGTDSAPHARNTKEAACGCAGCYTARHALSIYATAFEQAGMLEHLEAFTSFHGADFYGLPRNGGTITLERRTLTVETQLEYGEETLIPLFAGESLEWAVRA